MKRIAFISANDYAPWGGSEYCWAAAAERLVRAGTGVSVSVMDFGAPVKHVDQLRALGCRIFLRGKPSVARRARHNIFSGPDYTWMQVKDVAADADLAVVSVGGTLAGTALLEALRSQGTAYAIIVQSAAELWWPSDGLGEKLAELYEGARMAYFVSEANRDLVRRQFGTRLERAKVIRNPFNVSYDARPAWPECGAETLSLACVARLDAVQKGQEMLMEALDRPHWRERDLRVTFYGEGLTGNALRKLARSLGLRSVEFAGFAGNVEELWARHHALVLPSRFEGMPLALVEVMLCGRPGIVTDVGGNREIVRDGVNGFLAQAPTVEFIDEVLNRAWENRTRLKEMGAQAAEHIRRVIPRDPTAEFVQELLSVLGTAYARQPASERASSDFGSHAASAERVGGVSK